MLGLLVAQSSSLVEPFRTEKGNMMDRPSIKEQTLGISHEEAVNDQEAIRPGVTTRMVMLSLFIGLIGWVFNFDLQWVI